MKVCVSLNGVLANTPKAMVGLIARDLGIKVPEPSFSKALVGKPFPSTTHGGRVKRLGARGYDSVKSRLFDTDEFLNTPPVRGAVEAMQELAAAGCEIRIVTDAKSVTRDRVLRWLEKHGFPEGMGITLTRKGRRPKEPHQCACEVVVDHEIERLATIAQHAEVRLIHFVPERGTAGSQVRPESFDPRILSLHGWREVLPTLLEQKATALAA
jgi:hypothetical protein